MSTPATVYIVDDDESVRTALSNLLRSSGYRTRVYASAQEFIDDSSDEPGCLILDLQMPQTNGLELQERLSEQAYHPPIIFLTGYGDVPSTATALKKGAVDFLEKPVDETLLLAAVTQALATDQLQRRRWAETRDIDTRLARLTAREYDVLRYVIGGNLNKQIAYALGISEKTVKVHRARVMEKMAVDSVAALVRLTEKAGIRPVDAHTT